MTALDVKQAKQALAWRLGEWGVDEAPSRAAEFIDDLVSRGWQMSPERESRPRPPKPDQQCRVCGRAMHAPDAVCDQPTTRPTPKPADVSSRIAVLRTNVVALRPKTDQPEGDPA